MTQNEIERIARATNTHPPRLRKAAIAALRVEFPEHAWTTDARGYLHGVALCDNDTRELPRRWVGQLHG